MDNGRTQRTRHSSPRSRSPSTDRHDGDVCVIGGGLAGLVAATHAARAGARVVLAERSPKLGGRARSSRTADGCTLNLGPHALYRGGAAWEGLRELGIPVTGGVPRGGDGLWCDEFVPLPQGPAGLLQASWLGVRGRLQVARVLASLTRPPAAALDHVSWGEHVRTHASDPRARALLLSFARLSTYAADERIAARAVLTNLRAAAMHGVLYLDGGWQHLVDAAADTAQRAGVRTVVGAGSIELTRDHAGWRVRGRGLDLHAASVVVAVGTPRRTSQVLTDVLDPTAREGLADRVVVRAAVLDVALRRLPRPDRRFLLGLDRPVYLSVHSAWADLASGGGAVVHVARYVDRDEQADAGTRDELEQLLERVQPGWRDRVTEARFLPDMVVTGDVAPAARGGLAGRQPVTVEPGLHLAGDWVGPDGVLTDAVFASARTAGRAAAGDARRRRAVVA